MTEKTEIITKTKIKAELAKQQARILRAKIEIEEAKKRLKELTASKPKVRPRMVRSQPRKIIRITTPRWLDILEVLYYCRVANTEVFQAVIKGSEQVTRMGLRDLFDNGYIGLPPVQWMIHKVYKGFGRSINIYTLTNKGMKALQEHRGLEATKTDLNAGSDALSGTTLFHDNMLTIVWACHKRGLEERHKRLEDSYNLLGWFQDQVAREHLKMTVKHPKYKKEIVIIPDIATAIQCPKSRFLFFWEYYRTKKGGHHTHLDKLMLYNLIHKQGLFTKFGIKKGFRVITLVPKRSTAQRLVELINTTEKYKNLQHYRFWFVSEEDFRLWRREPVEGRKYNKQILDAESLFEPIFLTPYDGGLHSLEE